MNAAEDSVQTEIRTDNILLVTLNRPKANAIDVGTSRKMFSVFERFERDPALRVAVLTGAGERFFSAGWDLKAAAGGEDIQADHGPGGFAGLTEYFSRRKPVIAAVNGLSFGGGFELALAADLIIASETASFGLPEVTLGMVADSGGVLRLPKRLPAVVATEMLLTGRRMNAAESLKWGLVADVVSAPELLERALALASTIAGNAPLAVAAIRQILRATEGVGVEEGYRLLRSGSVSEYDTMLSSQDALEGPRAFSEKRTPNWTGQ